MSQNETDTKEQVDCADAVSAENVVPCDAGGDSVGAEKSLGLSNHPEKVFCGNSASAGAFADTPVESDTSAGTGSSCTCKTPDASVPVAVMYDGIDVSQRVSDLPGGNKLFLWFFLGLFLFSLYLLYLIAAPFIHTIILGCVFSALSYPLYSLFLRYVKKPPIASLLVLLCITFLVVLPIIFFVIGLIGQAGQSIQRANAWLGGADLGEAINAHVMPLVHRLDAYFPDLQIASLDIRGSIIQASSQLGQHLIAFGTFILSNALMFVLHFGFILLIMFFLLIDGAPLVRQLAYYLPLKPRQTTVIIEGLRRVSKSVLVGGFAVAILQGVVGAIGFMLVGIPAFFWGTVMVFAALIPVVGTGLVWVPAACVMLITGHVGKTVFLAVWFLLLVASIDSFLRPVLMRGGANVPILFIFFSILGGVSVFGMLGLLYGPMILAFFAVMLKIYGEEYDTILRSRRESDAVYPLQENERG